MKSLMRRFCAMGVTAGLVLALQVPTAPFIGAVGLAAIVASLMLFALLTLTGDQPAGLLIKAEIRKSGANNPRF